MHFKADIGMFETLTLSLPSLINRFSAEQRAVMEQQIEYDEVILPRGAVWEGRLLESRRQCSARSPQIKDKNVQY